MWSKAQSLLTNERVHFPRFLPGRSLMLSNELIIDQSDNIHGRRLQKMKTFLSERPSAVHWSAGERVVVYKTTK